MRNGAAGVGRVRCPHRENVFGGAFGRDGVQGERVRAPDVVPIAPGKDDERGFLVAPEIQVGIYNSGIGRVDPLVRQLYRQAQRQRQRQEVLRHVD